MFGRVLDHEAKDILNEGIEIGREEAAKDMSFRLHSLGVDISVIAEAAEVDEQTVRKWIDFKEWRLAELKNIARNRYIMFYSIEEISKYLRVDEKTIAEWVEDIRKMRQECEMWD